MEHLGCCNDQSQFQKDCYEYLKAKEGYVVDIIPYKLLNFYLNLNKPANLKRQKDIETWEGKIRTIVTSYQTYTIYLCQNNYPGQNHAQIEHCLLAYRDNLNNFKFRMDNDSLTNYSLHY
uniref:hypothetical protein n=1 Tax=Bidens bipinnata TaxID=1527831 RepID=UPI001EDD92D4|nr:hypothetical protein MFQ52_mgp56 [Bidens bipinnata]YP_010352627.1 hypothetical protein LK193_mgp57 [Bidens tripartita]YP_010352689.1 hypothetical protein MFU86_mgp56 [Bidens biternata]UIR99350.1 hypothetical protein [Bidens alba var. radiata]UIR98982.1 hypothetical protein [Bidens tripartita]UIR99043.1 hypothetical protein [Bidens bipinnata]UIR99106.1 hypothetical protein [Bidens biternata]UIR99168.1 hypothetical protein [Bidens biternata]